LASTRILTDRFTGSAEVLSLEDARDLVDLSIVNELDVYERSEEIAAKAGDYFRAVFPTWEPVASPSVMADCRRVLRI
jgi:hypothetical protein